MSTTKEITEKQIAEAKAELFKLCDDFNGEDNASDRIEMLSDIVGTCFPSIDEGGHEYELNYILNTHFRVNQLMVFLAALQEKINKIETFQNRLKKPEFACY